MYRCFWLFLCLAIFSDLHLANEEVTADAVLWFSQYSENKKLPHFQNFKNCLNFVPVKVWALPGLYLHGTGCLQRGCTLSWWHQRRLCTLNEQWNDISGHNFMNFQLRMAMTLIMTVLCFTRVIGNAKREGKTKKMKE